MTIRPRRSMLYMPGSNARAIDKARTLGDTDNEAVALVYICADFLGTPDASLE